ncbi:TIGR03750 family conjugal transfer protein [Pseudorhodoferax sp. Leaf267]|uniref:TIGR03750 family conjugal transfer protein n=1 Tax=Pseudorhodoferax sp. Leaf267 TaxID=1736316 RepID=UPI0012E16E58|nr:TIGR03750 family conjugal transfer protein [Pseudorhodoferax sp. Leaf267]
MSNTPPRNDGSARVPLTDRVNSEPAILHGMTSTEASWIGGVSFAVYFTLTGMVIMATGLWQLMLAPLIATIATLWYGSMALQRVKRDRPDGYYTHVLQRWMSTYGLSKARFLRHAGYWSLGRTSEISLTSSLSPDLEHEEQPADAAVATPSPDQALVPMDSYQAS